MDLKNQDILEPGETALVYVTFLLPQCLLGRLAPQKPFLLRESDRTVGKGKILALLDFEQHAEQARQAFGECGDPISSKTVYSDPRPRYKPKKKKR